MAASGACGTPAPRRRLDGVIGSRELARRAVRGGLSAPCAWAIDRGRRVHRAVVALGVALAGLMALTGAEVRAAPPSGRVFTVAGNHGEDGPLRFGRPATEAPLGVATIVLSLPDGGFLLDDVDHPRVVEVEWTGVLRAFAGDGHSGSGGDRGPVVRARFWEPSGLARRPDGGVVILDDVAGSA